MSFFQCFLFNLHSMNFSVTTDSVPFVRLYQPGQQQQPPIILGGNLGLEWAVRGGNRYQIVGVVQFPTENVTPIFFRPQGERTIISNYFPLNLHRPTAINIQNAFETPENARCFLENTLRVYQRDGEPIPTIGNFDCKCKFLQCIALYIAKL